MRTFPAAEIDEFKAQFRGTVLGSGDESYDEVRQIWNAMIDRKPGADRPLYVAAADVVRAVAFARKHSLVVSMRGGGHNIAGNAVCDGGLMIDLSLMKTRRGRPDRTPSARSSPAARLATSTRGAGPTASRRRSASTPRPAWPA